MLIDSEYEKKVKYLILSLGLGIGLVRVYILNFRIGFNIYMRLTEA